jgi:hypothetical protein
MYREDAKKKCRNEDIPTEYQNAQKQRRAFENSICACLCAYIFYTYFWNHAQSLKVKHAAMYKISRMAFLLFKYYLQDFARKMLCILKLYLYMFMCIDFYTDF